MAEVVLVHMTRVAVNKIFPIKSDTACLLKWAWSSVYFNSATTSSCHRTYKFGFSHGSEFHNVPEKLGDRQKMIDGEWPGNGCEYCKNIEDAGGHSDRMAYTNNIYDPELIPQELNQNNNSLLATPTIMEVYFKNTCNMKCVYCNSNFSSLWEDENRKFGGELDQQYTDIIPQIDNTEYDRLVKEFWGWLSGGPAKRIRRFHILGGEPFLLSELDDTIDFWGKHGHPDLTISIISNLNIPHERFKKFIDKFKVLFENKKLWHLQLTGSLDGWGPEQEYVRAGLDLTTWQKNFEYILETPWIVPSINCTLSSLTIKILAPLLERINDWNKKQSRWQDEFGQVNDNRIVFSFNTSAEHTDPYIFGSEVFDDDLKKILSLMPDENSHQKNYKNIMSGVSTKMKQAKKDPNKIKQLIKYLNALDARRNTDWRELFGWIEKV